MCSDSYFQRIENFSYFNIILNDKTTIHIKPASEEKIENVKKFSDIYGKYVEKIDLSNLTNFTNHRSVLECIVKNCLNTKEIRINNEKLHQKSFLPIKNLPLLEKLSLIGCKKVTNLAFLNKLTKLRSLHLKRCTSLKNINALSILVDLKILYLNSCNEIRDFKAIKHLKSIECLKIKKCTNIKNLKFINNLRFLEKLTISKCETLKKFSDINFNQLNLNKLSISIEETDFIFFKEDLWILKYHLENPYETLTKYFSHKKNNQLYPG